MTRTGNLSEGGLGNTAEGRKLLSYPHFIGTIHSFVNDFLALPWLRSLRFPVRVIDDQLCERHRRRLLASGMFAALRTYIGGKERNAKVNVVAGWRITSPSFDVTKKDGKAEFLDANCNSASQLRKLAEICVKDGYYRYDEMFTWANDLLNKCPEIRD